MNLTEDKLRTLKEKEKVWFPYEDKKFIILKKKNKLYIEPPFNFFITFFIKIGGFFIVFFGFIILLITIANILDNLRPFDYKKNGEYHFFSTRAFFNEYIEKLAIILFIILYLITRKVNTLLFKFILKKYYGMPYQSLSAIIFSINKKT